MNYIQDIGSFNAEGYPPKGQVQLADFDRIDGLSHFGLHRTVWVE